MRLQLALNVKNIDDAVQYYSKLFNSKPHKRKDGYANFAIANPPLKLVLLEDKAADSRINHLGVEVLPGEDLNVEIDRLQQSSLVDKVEGQTNCCYAIQDKAWTTEPEGLKWEWYQIIDDNPAENTACESGVCCANDRR